MARVVLHSRFNEIAGEIPVRVDRAVHKGMKLVERDAKARVPVRTGRLKRSIAIHKITMGEYVVSAGDRDAFYAHMIEYGTVHHAARPFLTPAFESNKVEMRALIKNELAKL